MGREGKPICRAYLGPDYGWITGNLGTWGFGAYRTCLLPFDYCLRGSKVPSQDWWEFGGGVISGLI